MKIIRSIDNITRDLLLENEKQANKMLCMAMLIMACSFPVIWALSVNGNKDESFYLSCIPYGAAVAILLSLVLIAKKTITGDTG